MSYKNRVCPDCSRSWAEHTITKIAGKFRWVCPMGTATPSSK